MVSQKAYKLKLDKKTSLFGMGKINIGYYLPII